MQPLQCFLCTSHVTLVNVRSIIAKLADIESDFELLSADVLCFCETWLSPAQPSPVIKADHVTLRCDRTHNDHKGGTMLSVPTCLCPNRTAIFASNGIESVVTAVHIQGQVLQVAVVYRAPIVPMQLLLQHMITLLHHVNVENKATVVMGNFNDGVLSASSSRVEQFMLSHGYTYTASKAIY